MQFSRKAVMSVVIGAAVVAGGTASSGLISRLTAKSMARNFGKDLSAEIGRVESAAFDRGPGTRIRQMRDGSSFYFQTFRLRLRPFAKFTLPGITSLQVTPHVELHWKRDNPKGWKFYKPQGMR